MLDSILRKTEIGVSIHLLQAIVSHYDINHELIQIWQQKIFSRDQIWSLHNVGQLHHNLCGTIFFLDITHGTQALPQISQVKQE